MKNFNLKNSKLKESLKNNNLTIGSWLTIPHRSVVEIMSTAGFDWLAVDIEHSPINISEVSSMISQIQANGMQALIRIYKNDEVIIKRVLDAGADGIIVPMINSKKDAEYAVNFSKYPPIGDRGVGLNRAQYYGTKFENYKSWVNDNIVIIAQVEHINSLHNLQDIISTNGIDGILVGPYDLSASMGFAGEYHREEVKKAINDIVKISKKNKFPCGFHVIESDSKYVFEKINSGINFLAFSIDFFFMGDKVRLEMKKIKNRKIG